MPYPWSAGNVLTATDLNSALAAKSDLAMVQNAQTGTTYTFVLLDQTKLVTLSNASAVAVTLPLEATVAWPTGTQLRLLNQGAGTVTVAGAGGVTINGTPLTLAQYKGAVLTKTGTNTWTFLPFSSGVGAANFTNTATGTYSGYKYITYTASGTITIDRAGFADLLILAGGGGGGPRIGGGGGGGGMLEITNAYLPVGTLTLVVGAGGAGAVANPGSVGGQGISSYIHPYYAVGGGGGGGSGGGSITTTSGVLGGSGGGASSGVGAGGSGTPNQGNAGGVAVVSSSGGGGAGGVGVNGGAGPVGGNGGPGKATTITNVSVTYAGGGGGGTQGGTAGTGQNGGGNGTTNNTTATSATANTGSGGGGGGYASGNGGSGGAGGSGLVIVKVAV